MQYISRIKKSEQIIKEFGGGILHDNDESIGSYFNFNNFRSTLFFLLYNCIMTFSFERNFNYSKSSKIDDSAYIVGECPFILICAHISPHFSGQLQNTVHSSFQFFRILK